MPERNYQIKSRLSFSPKGNLHHDVKSFFLIAKEEEFKNIEHDFYEENGTGHRRIETLRVYTIEAKKYKKFFPTASEWKRLTSIVMIKSAREGAHFKTKDARFYIRSCQPSAELLLESSRKHWGIENSLHWTLDVIFREDESKI